MRQRSAVARLIEVNGKKYVLKGGASEEHLVSEQAADEAYRAAGIRVPPQRTLIAPGGRRYKVAELIEGQDLGKWWATATKAEQDAMRDKLIAGLDVDAMLGNWDVIGAVADNVLVDKNGDPWRIDICERCGKEYVVRSGAQRYCPDCGPTARAENERAKKRREKAEERAAGIPSPIVTVCAVCGRPFHAKRCRATTCSPECKRELDRRQQKAADAKRRPKKMDAAKPPSL